MRLFSVLLCMIAISLTFVSFSEASGQGYNNYGNYGYNSYYGGYRYGYSNPYYTYSYPSYYNYGYNYYQPAYQPYSCYQPSPTPGPQPAAAENTTDKVLKELMLRKLLNEQSGAVSVPKESTPNNGALTPEELAQLREVLKMLRDKAPASEKPPEKK